MKKQMGDFGVFWAMVWQQKVEKIVMVTKLKENGVRTGVFFFLLKQVAVLVLTYYSFKHLTFNIALL